MCEGQGRSYQPNVTLFGDFPPAGWLHQDPFGSECISGAEPFPEAKSLLPQPCRLRRGQQRAISLRDIYLHIQFRFTVPGLRMKCHLRGECHPIVGDKSNKHLLQQPPESHISAQYVGYLHSLPRSALCISLATTQTHPKPAFFGKSLLPEINPLVPLANTMITRQQSWVGVLIEKVTRRRVKNSPRGGQNRIYDRHWAKLKSQGNKTESGSSCS